MPRQDTAARARNPTRRSYDQVACFPYSVTYLIGLLRCVKAFKTHQTFVEIEKEANGNVHVEACRRLNMVIA